MSPTTVIEPLSERRLIIGELHRRQVLRLVDHDVPVGADLVVLAPDPAGLGAEQGAGLVEQRHVVVGPHDVVDGLGPAAEQQLDPLLRQRVDRQPGTAAPWTRTGRGAAGPGVSTGHISSSAARTSGCRRTWRQTSLGSSGVRADSARWKATSRSTKRRPALW